MMLMTMMDDDNGNTLNPNGRSTPTQAKCQIMPVTRRGRPPALSCPHKECQRDRKGKMKARKVRKNLNTPVQNLGIPYDHPTPTDAVQNHVIHVLSRKALLTHCAAIDSLVPGAE